MHRLNAAVSLSELSAAGVRLRPFEAATLVRELVRRVARGEVAGVPSAHVIRLSPEGGLSVEGPVDAGGRSVTHAAQLLESLLPPNGESADARVPGALKLVLARALGTLDLPAFQSLDEFGDALARFGSADPASAIASLVARGAERLAPALDPPPADDGLVPSGPAQIERFSANRSPDLVRRHRGSGLTVSDIRRARRATGLSLAQIAKRSRIPIGLLRQLEWGYLMNWPDGRYGRTQLVRYARAAGLDEEVVVDTFVPLLEDMADQQTAVGLKPPAPRIVEEFLEPRVDIEVLAVPVDDRSGRMRRIVLAALAIPALVVFGLLPTWWARATREDGARPATSTEVQSGRESTASRPQPSATDSPAERLDHAATAGGPKSARGNPARTETSEGERPRQARYDVADDDMAYSPSLASVGTAMFYNAAQDPALVPADTSSGGGAVLRITRIVDDAANNSHVRPSPDGRRIAFDSDRGGVRGVYLADADGKNVRRVSPDGFAAVPSWSPDGTRLAFVRAESSSPKAWNLWTLDLERGDLVQVTSQRQGEPSGGSWFPDGRHLAYSDETRLVIHDLDTGTERVFQTPRPPQLVRTPVVSPDGRHIIFHVQRNGVWLLDVPTGAMRRVLEDPTASEYTWSPDSRRVAYYSGRSGGWGVWVMAPR
jgi:cytoskeletal protein RodZ